MSDETPLDYLTSEVDPVLAPTIRKLLKDRPKGKDAVKKAIGDIVSGSAAAPPPDTSRQRTGKTNQEFLQEMRDGKCKLGCNLNAGSPLVAELAARQGFDWCQVDMQHSPYTYEKMAHMFQGIQVGGAKAFVRVAGPGDRHGIQQAFDTGADGILVPYVNTAQEVRDAISVAKYPGKRGKEGSRSLYLNIRAQYPGGYGNLFKHALSDNKQTMVAVQIETADAIKNLDAILQVPGLDIAFIGPGDLCSSMGLIDEFASNPMAAFTDPRFQGAVGAVAAGCAKYGVIPGFWSNAAQGFTMAQAGFRFIAVTTDIECVDTGLNAELADVKKALAEAAAETGQDVLKWDGAPCATPQELRNNQPFLEEMRNGEMKVGVNLNFGKPIIAEFAAMKGFNFCMVDAQHAPMDYEKMAYMFQAIQLGGARSFVRVGGPSDRAGIQQAFDLGANGVLVPFVNTAQDVLDVVSVAKYPGKQGKEGTRSLYKNIRSQYPGGMAKTIEACLTHNKQTMVAVQIETADAIKNLDAILQVPGLDIAFIGPGDLCSSMGLMEQYKSGECFADPRFQEAIGKVAAGCAKYGVIPGTWATISMVSMVAQFGFKFIITNAEMHVCQAQLAKTIDDCTENFKTAPVPCIPWARVPAAIVASDPASNQEYLQQMKDGKCKLGCNLNLGNPMLAELCAMQGFDFCQVDAQHAPYAQERMAQMFQAIHLGGAKAWIRVGGAHDRFGIQQAFDTGADGILVPYVNTADDVRAAIAVAKYPGKEGKEGNRSLYPNIRSQYPGGMANMIPATVTANKKTMVAVQIETADAIKNLDAILQVPGLDIAFIGPGDLCSSMGILEENAANPMASFTDPRFQGAVGAVLAGCAKYGVVPGIWSNDPDLMKAGFKFMVVATDLHSCQMHVAESCRKSMAAAEELGLR
jgi:4-hydroxy-2-oxoheptanedioate aldolase